MSVMHVDIRPPWVDILRVRWMTETPKPPDDTPAEPADDPVPEPKPETDPDSEEKP